VRLYRGEAADQEKGGGWFSTDPKKAALYGPVSYVDVSRDDLRHFAQGHGGEDEWLTDDEAIRSRAQPIGADAQKALNDWAAYTREEPPEPAPAPPPHDYMAEYEANQARVAAEQAAQAEPLATAPPTERPVPETPASNTDESKNLPTVTQEKHTKTGAALFAVRFPKKPDIEDLGGYARRMGGRWSSFRGGGMQPGWMFKTQEAADRFAAWAREKMGPEEAVPPQPQRAPGWEEIGKNYIGQTLYEDERGVRSLLNTVTGVRRTEPVGMRPTRGGMEISTDRTDRPEYQLATPHPTQPDRPVEYQPPQIAPKPDEQPALWRHHDPLRSEIRTARVSAARLLLRQVARQRPARRSPGLCDPFRRWFRLVPVAREGPVCPLGQAGVAQPLRRGA